MIRSALTLILGAGASAPYGFPTGTGLRRSILEDHNLRVQLAAYYGDGPVADFQRRFGESDIDSIDFFLTENPEFDEIGKGAIALSLIQCEDTLKLRGNWYAKLWNAMIRGDEEAGAAQAPVCIVTFNYDRSLEAYFIHKFSNLRNVSTAEAARLMNQAVQIFHVYGDLGPLPELPQKGRYARPYGYKGGPDQHAFIEAARGIEIVNRQNHTAPAFVEAREMIGRSNLICFLGFGFLGENMQRLDLDSVTDQKYCLASGMGLGGRAA